MTWEVREGDVRDRLAEMPAESVQCVVTSPPYFGLRDYGTGMWDGGDEGCDHFAAPGGGTGATGLMRDGRSELARHENSERVVRDRRQQYRETCGKCGARRIDQQIGLEPTPEAYVATMVEVFREVRRVLAKDGTVWVNLGDSYQANPGSGQARGNLGGLAGADSVKYQATMRARGDMSHRPRVAKPKDLLGIPWRLAFALQADGWYLRADIIWSKPNPMPESVTDRPTKAHEYVFLLSKQARYFYDADAVREPHDQPWRSNGKPERNNWSVMGQRAIPRSPLRHVPEGPGRTLYQGGEPHRRHRARPVLWLRYDGSGGASSWSRLRGCRAQPDIRRDGPPAHRIGRPAVQLRRPLPQPNTRCLMTDTAVKHCATCRCGAPKRKRSGGIKRTPADIRLSKEIRERDGWTCQWPGCGHVFTPPDTGGLSAAHCFGRACKVCTGSRGGWNKPHGCTRLDPDNLIALCTAHHFYADSHPAEKYELFRSALGEERFDALSAKANAKRDRGGLRG
jgi:DNA modification methylase